MKAEVDFEWPRALRTLVAAADNGTLEPRDLYPREVVALATRSHSATTSRGYKSRGSKVPLSAAATSVRRARGHSKSTSAFIVHSFTCSRKHAGLGCAANRRRDDWRYAAWGYFARPR